MVSYVAHSTYIQPVGNHDLTAPPSSPIVEFLNASTISAFAGNGGVGTEYIVLGSSAADRNLTNNVDAFDPGDIVHFHIRVSGPATFQINAAPNLIWDSGGPTWSHSLTGSASYYENEGQITFGTQNEWFSFAGQGFQSNTNYSYSVDLDYLGHDSNSSHWYHALSGDKGSTSTTTPAPDLTVHLSASEPSAPQGARLPIHFDVTNSGNANASGTPFAVYISGDTTITKSDLLLMSSDAGGLDAGSTVSIGTSFSLPGSLTPGTYYLGIIANGSGSIAESNTSNDVSNALPISVLPSKLVDLGSHGAAWSVSGGGDFNADGTTDLLWRDPSSGRVDQWQLRNGSWSKSIDLGATKPANWQLAGTGDFDGDGTSDVLWRDISNSKVDQWHMKNGNWAGSIDLGATKGADWTLAGAADFNGDGTTDVLWRNVNTSQVDQWQMKNGNWSRSIDLGATKGADWQVAGLGDFNGDGSADVLWRNVRTSQVDQWQMKNGNWSQSIDMGATKGANWEVMSIGDFNGDGTSDILWFNNLTGQMDHWVLRNGNWSSSVNDGFVDTTLTPLPIFHGDYNHDGRAEGLFIDANSPHLYDLVV